MDIKERYQLCSIELDCPPGSIRPGDLIESVLDGSGLTAADFETGTPFFGHQTWVCKDEEAKMALFAAHKLTFKARITELYNDGFIRYGTW
jgi:hypothetical protein